MHTKDSKKGKQRTKAVLFQSDILGTSGLYWKKHFSKNGKKIKQKSKIFTCIQKQNFKEQALICKCN